MTSSIQAAPSAAVVDDGIEVGGRWEDGPLATHGAYEALELEPKRLPLLRSKRDALDELLERQGRRRQRGDVHVASQPEELSLATAQVERQIAALLKDAQLAHPLA